jgi:hypothetical protein
VKTSRMLGMRRIAALALGFSAAVLIAGCDHNDTDTTPTGGGRAPGGMGGADGPGARSPRWKWAFRTVR